MELVEEGTDAAFDVVADGSDGGGWELSGPRRPTAQVIRVEEAVVGALVDPTPARRDIYVRERAKLVADLSRATGRSEVRRIDGPPGD